MNIRKTKLINRTCSSRIRRGFPRRMADICGTKNKLRTHAQCALPSRKQAESIGTLQQNIAKYSDYVAITALHSLQDISSTISATWEEVWITHPRSNRRKTAELGMTTHSIMYLRDRELQMPCSEFEAFYTGHVQCRITLCVCVLAPYFWQRCKV